MPPERIEIRSAEVGDGLYARRALPHRERRMVGAWCFLDHLGPLDFEAGHGLSVGPHPHIGLQTFSWMIEGTILHTDSLGYRQWIHPGQVNLIQQDVELILGVLGVKASLDIHVSYTAIPSAMAA